MNLMVPAALLSMVAALFMSLQAYPRREESIRSLFLWLCCEAAASACAIVLAILVYAEHPFGSGFLSAAAIYGFVWSADKARAITYRKGWMQP